MCSNCFDWFASADKQLTMQHCSHQFYLSVQSGGIVNFLVMVVDLMLGKGNRIEQNVSTPSVTRHNLTVINFAWPRKYRVTCRWYNSPMA